jgi:hypothetical protein
VFLSGSESAQDFHSLFLSVLNWTFSHINMDSTTAGSVNDNINMDSTIAGSVNDSINMDSTITVNLCRFFIVCFYQY